MLLLAQVMPVAGARRRSEIERLAASSGQGTVTDLKNVSRDLGAAPEVRTVGAALDATMSPAPAPLPEQYAQLLAAAAGRPKARGGLNTSEVKTALQRYGIDAIGSGLALRTLLGRALADGRILAPAAQPVTAGSGGTTATGLQHADDFADFTAAARHREHDAAGTQLQPAAVPHDVRRRPLQAHRHPPSRTGPP